MTDVRPDARRQLQNTSLEMTSSFFWSSPCTFSAPASPVISAIAARVTMELICLQAVAMELSMIAISESMVPAASCLSSHTLSVFIPYSVVVVVTASCVVVALHATDAEAVAIAALAESGDAAEVKGEDARGRRIEDEEAPRTPATRHFCVVVFLRVFIAMDIVVERYTE